MKKMRKLILASVVFAFASFTLVAQTTIPSNLLTGSPTAPAEYLGSSNPMDVLFKVGGIEKMRIASATGNIGIGTITPTDPLQIFKNTTGTSYMTIVNVSPMGLVKLELCIPV